MQIRYGQLCLVDGVVYPWSWSWSWIDTSILLKRQSATSNHEHDMTDIHLVTCSSNACNARMPKETLFSL